MKFSIKDFFSKCDKIRRKLSSVVTVSKQHALLFQVAAQFESSSRHLERHFKTMVTVAVLKKLVKAIT